jgi:hypothetical protein
VLKALNAKQQYSGFNHRVKVDKKCRVTMKEVETHTTFMFK